MRTHYPIIGVCICKKTWTRADSWPTMIFSFIRKERKRMLTPAKTLSTISWLLGVREHFCIDHRWQTISNPLLEPLFLNHSAAWFDFTAAFVFIWNSDLFNLVCEMMCWKMYHWNLQIQIFLEKICLSYFFITLYLPDLMHQKYVLQGISDQEATSKSCQDEQLSRLSWRQSSPSYHPTYCPNDKPMGFHFASGQSTVWSEATKAQSCFFLPCS